MRSSRMMKNPQWVYNSLPNWFRWMGMRSDVKFGILQGSKDLELSQRLIIMEPSGLLLYLISPAANLSKTLQSGLMKQNKILKRILWFSSLETKTIFRGGKWVKPRWKSLSNVIKIACFTCRPQLSMVITSRKPLKHWSRVILILSRNIQAKAKRIGNIKKANHHSWKERLANQN